MDRLSYATPGLVALDLHITHSSKCGVDCGG